MKVVNIEVVAKGLIYCIKTPQGDRPLPAPREAGPWAPAFGGAGLGRLGEWRPPGPSRFRLRFCFFFLHFSLLLCGTVEPCD